MPSYIGLVLPPVCLQVHAATPIRTVGEPSPNEPKTRALSNVPMPVTRETRKK
jgi:hypothetical protein